GFFIGAGIGFTAAGLTGKSGFDWNRALAGGISGGLVGAGIGAMMDGFGVLGSGLLNAGITSASMGGLFKSGQSVNWKGFGIGAAIGFASGVVAAWTGGAFGGWIEKVIGKGLTSWVLTGAVSNMAGNLAGQGTANLFGVQKG